MHPPNHQTLHPPMGGRVSTDFKSINGIEISQFVQVLLNFYLLCGPTLWGVRVGGWGGGGCVRGSPMHECIHIHMHACTHTHMHVKHDKHGYLHVGNHCNFYTCIHVCAYMCMHACACAHVWGHPHAHRHPPTLLPPPQSCREPKIPKFNKS